MKFLNDNTKLEKVLQEIEDILDDNGLQLLQGFNGFQFEDQEGNVFYLMDVENGEGVDYLPRELDSQRLVLGE